MARQSDRPAAGCGAYAFLGIVALVFAATHPWVWLLFGVAVVGGAYSWFYRKVSDQTSRDCHMPGFQLLKYLAHGDDRISRKESDVLAAYARSSKALPDKGTQFQALIGSNVPIEYDLPALISKAREYLSARELEMLISHVEMMQATRKKHPLPVAVAFNRILVGLRGEPEPTPPPPGPPINDLRLA